MIYLFHMLCITKHANLHLGTGNVRQLDRTTETLVLLRIIVLQPNLELNGLSELTVLLFGIICNPGDRFPKSITLKLTAKTYSQSIRQRE